MIPSPARTISDETVSAVIDLHFHPEHGSIYWLERERDLGIDARREIRSLTDLDRLGSMRDADLGARSVWDFVPRALQDDRRDLIVVESGGTLGDPKCTVFTQREFHDAFVAPFVAATRIVEFPRAGDWLWVGPSGPHAIGKAAREVARAMGSPDPFAVDFDPRWFKVQRVGSLGRERYLEHVVRQAAAILRREAIDVLFSTPPVLLAIAAKVESEFRSRVRGLHLGGLPVSGEATAQLREHYPRATILGGYGNSLLGMCPELDPFAPDGPVYYPHGSRLHFRVAPPDATPETWGGETVEPGVRGRLVATRVDPSFLIVHLFERDGAIRRPPPKVGAELRFWHDGLGSPEPISGVPAERLGIY